MKRLILTVLLMLPLFTPILSYGRAPLQSLSQDPYASALVLDAESGKVLFEENADATIYPASVLKLMTLYVILDRVDKGALRLDEMVPVTVEAARIGGSQVYLDPREQFPVDELLYALMVQSANDAAVALATHVTGSTEGFVALMNQKARELGMTKSRFNSVHGLPPGKGQEPDTTTARDLAILCRELVKHPQALNYTSTRTRDFRDGKFIMRNHNKLLGQVNGVDGLKTGYYQAAGFSIAATAQRSGVRIIALVMGSKDRKVRDAKATELLNKGFTLIPPKMEAVAVPAQQGAAATGTGITFATQQTADPDVSSDTAEQQNKSAGAGAKGGGSLGLLFIGIGIGFLFFLFVLGGVILFMKRRAANVRSRYRSR
ncbi:MAG: D-alanyl-D-alanine carboxypeptidase [Desulfobulbus sp.]|nr:D-alanyl-D-alanine carboxypeptidase [Desulfobulbus sp.]